MPRERNVFTQSGLRHLLFDAPARVEGRCFCFRSNTPKMLAVKPKDPAVAHMPKGTRTRYVPGRDKPLTLNPPHPLIKKVDDELALRGMAYGTRKAYGQHHSTTLTASLRNFFEWLRARSKDPPFAPENDRRRHSGVSGARRNISLRMPKSVRALSRR